MTTTTPAASTTVTPAAPTSAQKAAYDAMLVHRFNEGDEGAFVEIMSRYRRKEDDATVLIADIRD